MSAEEAESLHEVYARLTQNEQRVAGLVEAVDGLKGSVQAILTKLDGIAGRGTDWNTLAGWAAVVVVFCGSMGHLTVAPVHRRLEMLERCTLEAVQTRESVARLEERTKWMALASGSNIW